MPTEWYCQIDDETYGPLTPNDLRRMASTGKLKPTDFVKKSKSGKWIPAASVKGLAFQSAAKVDAGPSPGTGSNAAATVQAQPAPLREEILGVPASVARQHCVFPLSNDGHTLKLLTANNGDELSDKLQFILNFNIELVAAPVQKIRDRIERHYVAQTALPPASQENRKPATLVAEPGTSALVQKSPVTVTRGTTQTQLGVTDFVIIESEPAPRLLHSSTSFWDRLCRPFVLSYYANRIGAKVRDTHPQRASGLYDHEPYLQALGAEINARYGLQGMIDVFNLVEKRKGRGVTSELGRIWRNVGNWSY